MSMMQHTLPIKLPTELFDRLWERSTRDRISMASIVREALEQYLEHGRPAAREEQGK